MIHTFAAVFLFHAERLLTFHEGWARHLELARIAGLRPSLEAADMIAEAAGLRRAPRCACGGVAEIARA